MLTMLFRFSGGRYHATPWGHHVNEGLVEWPPSPWRLLRAIIATGFTKLEAPDPLPGDHVLRRLVLALADTLPSYRLPPRSPATHTRHYMPLGGNDGKTTLVLDACAVPGNAPLAVEWPCNLDGEARAYLGRILEAMGYLGRAESWVEARLVAEGEPLPDECRALAECVVHSDGMDRGHGWEQTPLLAPTRPEDYGRWREDAVAEALKPRPGLEGKKPPKELSSKPAKIEEPYPADLFACLTSTTTFWQKHGWSQPPGSRRQLYWRQSNLLETAVPVARRVARPEAPVEAMLLALASDTSQREVLPLFSRALPQAELLHRALVSRAPDSAVLRGKDAEGRPLTGHQHLHILPLSLDEPGRLDHFLLWAPQGLDAVAQRAIRGVRRTWTKGSESPLYVTLAGSGSFEAVQQSVGSRVRSRAWESVTPFVPPRFVKKTGRHTLEGQILAELTTHGLPPARVSVMSRDEWVERKFYGFVVSRRDEAKTPPQAVGFGIRLVFDDEVAGPLCLGYASHFGLGLFTAV